MSGAGTLVVLALVLLAAGTAPAQDRPAVVVTPGSARIFRAAVQQFADFSAAPDAQRAQRFRATLEEALAFSGVFQALSHEAFLGPVETPALDGDEPVVCPDWTQDSRRYFRWAVFRTPRTALGSTNAVLARG